MKKKGVEKKSKKGMAASRKLAIELFDPRPYAVGSLKEVYEKYPHIGRVLPAICKPNTAIFLTFYVPCDRKLQLKDFLFFLPGRKQETRGWQRKF
jgi:hypothetical protein